MAILAVDELMLREPRLLTPGLQPLGNVRVQNTAINRQLILAVLFNNGLQSQAIDGGISAKAETGTIVPVCSALGRGVGSEAAFGNIWRINHPGLAKLSGATHATVVGHVRFGGLQTGYSGFWTIATEASVHCIGMQDSGANTNISVWSGDGLSGAQIAASSFPLSDVVFVMRVTNATSSPASLWLSNGARDDGITAVNSAAWSSATRLILFGERTANTGYTTKGRFYAFLLWNRWLSDAEAETMLADPYQGVIPA